MNSKLKLLSILPVIYLLAVIVCVLMAFDFAGSINSEWVLVLIGLTLPWSIVSVFFVWSLIHGAGLGFFTVLYLVFAGINTFILYCISAKICKYYEEKNAV